MRTLVGAIVSIALASGCVGSGPRAPTSSGPAASASPITGAAPPTSSPAVLDRVVLTADLAEAPAAWDPVATIPFGRGIDRLGLVTDTNHTPIPYMPRSFAVASDGSFFLLDVVNMRVAHFSAGGAYLASVGGLYFDRFHPHPRDIAFADGRAYVLEEYARSGDAAGIATVPTVPIWSFAPLLRADRHAIALEISGTEGGPLAHVFGYADLASGLPDLELSYWARVDAAGQVHPIPGVPVSTAHWIMVHGSATEGPKQSQRFTVTYTNTAAEAVRTLFVRVMAHDRKGSHAIPAIVGVKATTMAPHMLVAYVQLSPARAVDQERYGGGRWLLGIPDDGSPLIWERMPEPGVSDEQQVRFVARGPDGALYLMVPEPDGEHLYRRPLE